MVTDNRKQFDNEKYHKMCSKLGIKCYFSLSVHPQANSQVKATNKVIKHHLKTKLDCHKGAWVGKLPSVLWVYRTIPHNITSETPYFLAFGAKVMIPMEIGLPSYKTTHFSLEGNNNNFRAESNLLEER